jgi:hypothetical protein
MLKKNVGQTEWNLKLPYFTILIVKSRLAIFVMLRMYFNNKVLPIMKEGA